MRSARCMISVRRRITTTSGCSSHRRMSSKTMAEVVIRSGGRDPPKRVRLLAHFAPGERNLSPESRVRGSQTRRGSSVDRAPRDAARAIRPGKRPEPVVVSVRSGFFLSEAGAFFSSTSVVQLASQVEPPLRDPIGGALGGGAGLGSFFEVNRTFSKSKQGERLCSLLQFLGD